MSSLGCPRLPRTAPPRARCQGCGVLDRITPVILTYNEAPNIGRTLTRLTWAEDIVVVDSGSEDSTREIVGRFPQARVVTRRFDTHANQWNHAIQQTGIRSEWILALDADYTLTPEFVDELAVLRPPDGVNGYQARFRYCIDGRPLRGSLYPPVTLLFRRVAARYAQDGHTQRVVVEGAVEQLRTFVLHDDRKPFRRWLASQHKYAKLEARKLRAQAWSSLDWQDRVRRVPFLSPLPVALYCMFVRGCALDGRAGLVYVGQRMIAEAALSIHMLSRSESPPDHLAASDLRQDDKRLD
jgi:glycosyltransferase involved in cell wall biosynthesis